MIFITLLGIYIGIGIALSIAFFSLEEGKELYRDAKSKVQSQGKKYMILFDAIVIMLFIFLMPIMVLKEYIIK